MAQGPSLHQVQRLSLQQVLAPQLQQSLHLLQVPTLELRRLVQQEMEQNPLLEEQAKETQSETDSPPEAETQADTEPQADIETQAEAERQTESDPPTSPETSEKDAEDKESSEEMDFKEEFEVLSKLDDEWREYFSQTSSFRARSSEQEEQRQHFFDSIVQPESLQQHLLEQLNFAALPDEQRKVAELIIGSISDDGYLVTPLDELALSSGVPLEKLHTSLQLVQSFHPVGVGARDLKECLLIQLSRLGKADSLEAVVIRDYLDDLGRKRYAEVARGLNITTEQVQQLANLISTLEPKPGRMFTSEQHQYVAADVIVQKVNSDYVVLLNDEQIPHVRISNTYKQLMARDDKSAETRDYIRDKIRAGKFLIKSIHQRQQTIYNIAKVIIERQKEFLEKGVSCLKPLTMAQVATAVGVHETTVSRAVANKYMQTPQGLYEMKFFFTPGFETASGASMSNTSVKEQISKLIEREDASKPLSDQEIVEILKEQGIPIARRTVAKYRNELNILPSNLRKQY